MRIRSGTTSLLIGSSTLPKRFRGVDLKGLMPRCHHLKFPQAWIPWPVNSLPKPLSNYKTTQIPLRLGNSLLGVVWPTKCSGMPGLMKSSWFIPIRTPNQFQAAMLCPLGVCILRSLLIWLNIISILSMPSQNAAGVWPIRLTKTEKPTRQFSTRRSPTLWFF